MDELFPVFAAIATAITVEAMPFLALGALLSAVIEVFVSPARLARSVPAHLPGQIAAGVLGGVIFPTCECGVVPVARRLLKKGAPAPAVVAYLLSAPIMNPIVLVSTFVAFRGSVKMVIARAAVAAVVATSVALLVRGATSTELVREGVLPSHGHDHSHESLPSKLGAVWRHAAGDFLDMGKYLVLGAFAAAAFKTFVSPTALTSIDGNLALSIAGMMFLAVVLSVCSEADAFVAVSFVTFPAAAHLAFVTLGPMVDIKLVGLYAVTFRPRLFAILVLVPTALVFALCFMFGVLT